MKSIALVLISFLFAQVSVAQPGTRKLKVVKEEGLSICLQPRDCQCKKPEPDEKGRLILCDCWSDFNPEDQPAVVGKMTCVLCYARAFETDLLIAFACGQSNDGQIYVRIPSPGLGIKRFLDFFGASEHFLLLKPGETIDAVEFLKIVAQEKWVIADKDEQAEETRAYQMYLHDLNNHLFLWWLLPTELRTLVKVRANALDQLFDRLKTRSWNSSFVVDYLQLLHHLAALKIDVKMGNLNLKAMNVIQNTEEMITSLEAMINFDIVPKVLKRKPGMFYRYNLQPNQFALSWICVYIKFFRERLEEYVRTGEFLGAAQFLHDRASKPALERFKDATPEIIKELINELKKAIGKIVRDEGVPEKSEWEAHPFEEEFSRPFEVKLKEAIESQNNDTSHGLNVRALLANPEIPSENANAIASALRDSL